jgi:hypothetical protein
MKGPTGATGPGFVWKGAYNGATAYVVNDIVSYTDGNTYICILAGTGHLPTNATYFSLFTAAGATGGTGTAGQGLTFRGAYNGATAYVPYDLVTSGGNLYICILASTGNAVSNATFWTLVAQMGATGAAGARGSIFQPSVANAGALPTIDGVTVIIGDMCFDAAGILYQVIA